MYGAPRGTRTPTARSVARRCSSVCTPWPVGAAHVRRIWCLPSICSSVVRLLVCRPPSRTPSTMASSGSSTRFCIWCSSLRSNPSPIPVSKPADSDAPSARRFLHEHPRPARTHFRTPRGRQSPAWLPSPPVPGLSDLRQAPQGAGLGCGYERVADQTCSARTLRRRGDEWIAAGTHGRLHQPALASYDRILGLDLDHDAAGRGYDDQPCREEPTGKLGGEIATCGVPAPIQVGRRRTEVSCLRGRSTSSPAMPTASPTLSD
jgi:hypothetical protein